MKWLDIRIGGTYAAVLHGRPKLKPLLYKVRVVKKLPATKEISVNLLGRITPTYDVEELVAGGRVLTPIRFLDSWSRVDQWRLGVYEKRKADPDEQNQGDQQYLANLKTIADITELGWILQKKSQLTSPFRTVLLFESEIQKLAEALVKLKEAPVPKLENLLDALDI